MTLEADHALGLEAVLGSTARYRVAGDGPELDLVVMPETRDQDSTVSGQPIRSDSRRFLVTVQAMALAVGQDPLRGDRLVWRGVTWEVSEDPGQDDGGALWILDCYRP